MKRGKSSGSEREGGQGRCNAFPEQEEKPRSCEESDIRPLMLRRRSLNSRRGGESSDKSRKPIHVALSPEQEEKYASVAFYHSLMQMVDAGLTSADADML
ncbi:hypothetical protein V6N13_068236 [Hibiscus sabdariffa]|uniref:Uncharacterized protein n=1 Tax=Hibiscus sabdariffa TaxID=183260 RepID=A0ABR1ZVZ9_9ROSI